MAASQPRRGASVDQAQRLYTIRPLKWRRSMTSTGRLVAGSAVGCYGIEKRDDGTGYRVRLLVEDTFLIVAGSATVHGAKVAASYDLRRRLLESIKPVRKAVRRG